MSDRHELACFKFSIFVACCSRDQKDCQHVPSGDFAFSALRLKANARIESKRGQHPKNFQHMEMHNYQEPSTMQNRSGAMVKRVFLRRRQGAKGEVDRLNKVPAALRKPCLPDSVDKIILPFYTPVSAAGKRGGELETRSQQTCPVIQSTATFSSQRPHDTHVLRTGSHRRSTGARSASQGQCKLESRLQSCFFFANLAFLTLISAVVKS